MSASFNDVALERQISREIVNRQTGNREKVNRGHSFIYVVPSLSDKHPVHAQSFIFISRKRITWNPTSLCLL